MPLFLPSLIIYEVLWITCLHLEYIRYDFNNSDVHVTPSSRCMAFLLNDPQTFPFLLWRLPVYLFPLGMTVSTFFVYFSRLSSPNPGSLDLRHACGRRTATEEEDPHDNDNDSSQDSDQDDIVRRQSRALAVCARRSIDRIAERSGHHLHARLRVADRVAHWGAVCEGHGNGAVLHAFQN